MIKKTLRIKVVLLVVFFLFLQSNFAQDYTRWSLPEGAIARLGKGDINDIAYSPDSARLAVASSIGTWLLDAHTGEEIALLARQMRKVSSVAFSPDGVPSRAGVVTVRYCFGIQRPGGTREPSKGLQRGLIPLRIHRMERRWQVGMETIRFVCGTP